MCSLMFFGTLNLYVQANQAVFCFSKTELSFTPAKVKLRGLRQFLCALFANSIWHNFPVRMVRPWHRLPREAVATPSLEVSKARLDGAWSNLK